MSLKSILKPQYEQAKLRGWIPHFAKAGQNHGFATADLMAIASRETNMKNIKGDFRDGYFHGFSLMQLDIDSHREWIESGKWQDVATAIEKGAAALAEKRAQIVRVSRQATGKVRFSSGKTATFTPRALTPEALRQCTFAAYNCGLASYYHYSIGNDIDRGTTGKNYGRAVVQRAAIFQQFLEADGLSSSPQSPVAPPAVRPAESVHEQESAESQAENSAKVSAEEAGTDLLGAAVSSPKAKAAGLKLWPRLAKHGSAGATFLWAIVEANKVASILVALVVLAGIAWLVYHNRQTIKAQLLKMLK